jgi:putative redox protein
LARSSVQISRRAARASPTPRDFSLAAEAARADTVAHEARSGIEEVRMPAQPSVPSPIGEGVVVAETGRGRFQVEARTATSDFLVDEPIPDGGLGSGPGPYDLLSAALGACTAMTVRLYAQRKGWPLERVQVSVLHHRATLQARDLFDRTIDLRGALDEEQRDKLIQVAQRCPVHLTLERGADVRTTLSASEPTPSPSAASGEHMRDMEEACSG